jgi:hypothetical protein
MGPTVLLPLRRKACWGFFCPKNPTASAGCEHANLGTKGQHATSRPPKPLCKQVTKINLKWMIQVTKRRERRSKQLLDELKETRGYWKLKEEILPSYSVENLLKKVLWTCRKTDYSLSKCVPKNQLNITFVPIYVCMYCVTFHTQCLYVNPFVIFSLGHTILTSRELT